MKKELNKTSVVKIDPHLLKRVDDFIKKDKNKFRYINKKQLIDIAVFEFLKKEDING